MTMMKTMICKFGQARVLESAERELVAFVHAAESMGSNRQHLADLWFNMLSAADWKAVDPETFFRNISIAAIAEAVNATEFAGVLNGSEGWAANPAIRGTKDDRDISSLCESLCQEKFPQDACGTFDR